MAGKPDSDETLPTARCFRCEADVPVYNAAMRIAHSGQIMLYGKCECGSDVSTFCSIDKTVYFHIQHPGSADKPLSRDAYELGLRQLSAAHNAAQKYIDANTLADRDAPMVEVVMHAASQYPDFDIDKIAEIYGYKRSTLIRKLSEAGHPASELKSAQAGAKRKNKRRKE